MGVNIPINIFIQKLYWITGNLLFLTIYPVFPN